MDGIISRLSSIEQEASSIMEESVIRKNEIDQAFAAEKTQWKQRLLADTEARILEIRKSSEESIRRQITQEEAAALAQLARIEDHYEKHGSRHLEEIFRAMTRVNL